ncbi:MAG: PaaI family thioesterase [Betaproteobacteria bacterium]|nr:PaaI family thioesterase [Betaproteobacteria bacterium]
MAIRKKTTKSPKSPRKNGHIKTDIGLVPEKLRGFGAALQRAMGVKITYASKKKILAEMPAKAFVLNRNARANGGALMAYADCIGAAGALMNLPEGHWTTTLESKTNFFSAGVGPLLKASSKPLHVGRTTIVLETTIRNSGDDRRVAIVTQTQMVIPNRK